MSFSGYRKLIEEGDTAIIYLDISSVYAITVTKGGVFQTRYGALKHDDLVGKPFGGVARCSKGYAYALHPTPELWTLTVPHRTQILYSPDISVVSLQLDLKPGSVVCEAGTGSGSLSHAILRTIAPTGHLYTFDFHELRVQTARDEFERHGVAHLVTVQQRDVVSDGFGREGIADAVFLDLPLPWEVVPSAVKALKSSGGRVCSFSPCIEQVQKTTEALVRSGCLDVVTMECLLRAFEVRNVTLPTLRVEERGSSVKAPTSSSSSDVGESGDHRQREEEQPMEVTTAADEDEEPATTTTTTKTNKRRTPTKKERRIQDGPHRSVATAFPRPNMTGHTGYLTFASLFPR